MKRLLRLPSFLMATALVFAIVPADAFGQRRNQQPVVQPQQPVVQQPRPAAPASGIKPYSEIIPPRAVTDKGLFDVHKVDARYFYEIPDSLFGKEMLMVTRISKTATDIGYGGEQINNQVLRWEKKDNKVLLRVVSYNNISSGDSIMLQSVLNSNLEPIMAAFDVKSLSKDGNGVVIDVTDLFSKDVQALSMPAGMRTNFRVTTLDDSRSYVEHIKSFPMNIEARKVLTYRAAGAPSNSSVGSITLEINNSMLLLPAEPMMPRLADNRVGYFSQAQVDFGLDEQKAVTTRYIRRWRLEPKPEDMDKYLRGELVEPKKQIVYYIDPATPEKWRPYLKQGVDDWQVAFEAAGFKNAIVAKDPPTFEEDPEFSPEDARYSVIRYFASDIQNAYGPHVADPRTGEILESDIGWYHNVMNLLRNWYFIQTAAFNPEAQGVKFKDEVMGRLIRFVSAHEVGHTIGLPHNMGSSNAYPVDSLRSKNFTQKFNTAPSIMDYARFNYVAQPGDEGVALMPDIGPYDKWSVEWGYRYIPNVKVPQDESAMLNQWVLDKKGDKIYRFGRQTGNPIDPRSQTEDLGDDAVKASMYGIANLKRLIPNLEKWSYGAGKDYSDLQELYLQVIGQYNRYMGHVRSNIGGIYETYKSMDQAGAVYEHTPKNIQQGAMKFLNEQAFTTPMWLIDNKSLAKFEDAGHIDRMRAIQAGVLNGILDFGRLARVIEAESVLGTANAYTINQLFTDIRGGIWTELNSGRAMDVYRRNLQRAHIDRLSFLMTNDAPVVPAAARSFVGATPVNASQSDIRPMVRQELRTLQTSIRANLPKFSGLNRAHLEDALARIDAILNPKS